MAVITDDKIGQYRQKVYMLKNVPTNADTGGAYDHYGIAVTTRGRLRKWSGNRLFSFGDIVNAESYELLLRYQADVANNIRVDTKFMIDNLVYTIDTWELIEERRSYYKIRLNINRSGSITVTAPTPVSAGVEIRAVWLTTDVGTFTVVSSLLTGAEILGVAREGTTYTLVSGTPGNLQVSFSGSTLTFNNAFNAGEIVYVLYKN